MGKKIAVKGCTVEISVASPDSITCSHTEIGSTNKVKAEGKDTYFGKLTTNISAIVLVLSTYPVASGWTVTPSPVLSIDINGTAVFVKDDDKVAVLENDEGSASLAYVATNALTGATVSGTVTVKAKIADAGQTSVTAS